jgi:iron complex outermembrane recepter protein
MDMNRSVLLASAAGLAAVFSVASSARAQSAGAVVEELVVTAQKREAGLQEVPAAISALSDRALEMRGVDHIEGLTTQVPNMTWGEQSGTSLITIRGVGTSVDTGIAEPNVALHVDGVYLSRQSMSLLDLTDLSRVEVLRGPQGTLYGRNSTGGAINLISKPPSQSFEGELTGGVGNYGHQSLSTYVSGPIAAGVLARLSAYARRSDGYFVNIRNNDDQAARSFSWGFRGALRFTPDEQLTIDLSGRHQVLDQRAYTAQQILATGPAGLRPPGAAAAISTLLPRRVGSDLEGEQYMSTTALTADATWQPMESLRVRSITGYVDHRFHQSFDGDTTSYAGSVIGRDPGDPRYSSQRSGDTESFSQEINVSGKLADRLDVLVGVFYFRERFEPNIPAVFPNGIPGVPLPAPLVFYQFGKERVRSFAVFTDETLHLSDRLRLSAGVRYSHDRKSLTQSTGIDAPPIPRTLTAACTEKRREVTDRTWTPRAAVEFDAAKGVLAYVQFAKGFRQGGFNISDCNDDFKGERVEAFEAGLKSTVLEGRAIVNLSAFHYDYTNLQTFQINGTTAQINNAPATVKGAEVEVAFTPTRAVQLNGALGYLDAQYGGFLNTDPMFPAAGLQQLRGNRLNRSPKWTASAGVEVTQPAERLGLPGGGEIAVRGEIFRSSAVYYRPFNLPVDRQGAYTLVNAFAEYRLEDGLKFRAWVKNLTDKDYKTQVVASSTFNLFLGLYGAPRTFGFEIEKAF